MSDPKSFTSVTCLTVQLRHTPRTCHLLSCLPTTQLALILTRYMRKHLQLRYREWCAATQAATSSVLWPELPSSPVPAFRRSSTTATATDGMARHTSSGTSCAAPPWVSLFPPASPTWPSEHPGRIPPGGLWLLSSLHSPVAKLELELSLQGDCCTRGYLSPPPVQAGLTQPRELAPREGSPCPAKRGAPEVGLVS